MLPKLTVKQWLHAVAGLLCFTYSWGFIRSWPNLFQQMRTYAMNTTGTIFLDNTAIAQDIPLETFSITSGCMLNGLFISQGFCGFILPKLGNRLSTFLSAICLILGYFLFPIFLTSQNWTVLYVISMFLIGVPMGIANSAAQNSIKNAISGVGRGFATTTVLKMK